MNATFTSAGLPLVSGQSFTDVGSGSATLNAQVDPERLSTQYLVEYGLSTAYGSTTLPVSIGAGEAPIDATTQLSGLTPSTVYHFRVVAVNEGGTTLGPDVTFSTLPQAILGLPDGRVFERVSPVDNGQAEVDTPNVFGLSIPWSEGEHTPQPFAVSSEGNTVVYEGAATVGGKSEANAYLATWSAAGGWQSNPMDPPGRGEATDYFGFSANLSAGIIFAASKDGGAETLPPLSPEAPAGYKIPYEHSLSGENYVPLVTKSAPIHRPVSANSYAGLKITYAGSSTDLSRTFFGINDALTEGALEIKPDEYNRYRGENLYESVDGRLSLINVLPDGSSVANAVFGAPCVARTGSDGVSCFNAGGGVEEQATGGESADLSRAISSDGSRVFWTDLDTGDVYVREDPTSSEAKTVEVNAGIGGSARFWTASTDGSKVFFTSGARFSVEYPPHGELYEYELETGRTIDLTPGVEVAGVIGASENGEYVYYADAGDNLYLWHAGISTYIASVSTEDGGENSDGGEGSIDPYKAASGDWYTSLGERTAEVTPDGQALEFMSDLSQKVVGYPNGTHNGGLEEVYVYEAEGGGRLFCASCSSAGELPPVATYGASAFVPVSFQGSYQSKVISDDGMRVFFDSAEPLVPQDTNGKLDVYEWERNSAGSCSESAGCIYLLSGGQSGSASWLLGSSESGNDVFVISRAPLVSGDPYEAFALYDARVDGMQPPAAAACQGTGCQGVPPPPPIFATPASVTFGGVGNFPAPTPVKPKPRAKPKVSKCKKGQLRTKSGSCKKSKDKRTRQKSKSRKGGK